MTVEATLLVSGYVQGVGFRDWTRRRLNAYGLTGSATNRSDGRVEVVARGERADVERLLALMRAGESPGSVSDVDVSWAH